MSVVLRTFFCVLDLNWFHAWMKYVGPVRDAECLKIHPVTFIERPVSGIFDKSDN